MRAPPYNNESIARFYPRVVQEPNSPRIHALIDDLAPIGKDRLLWDITYPLDKIDVNTVNILSDFCISLSTIRNIKLAGRTSEEFGEQIISQFIFPGYYALMFSPKNAYGILAHPVLQIEYKGHVLLVTKVSHKKFEKAFQCVQALVLQQYCNGGQKLQEVNAAVSKYVEGHISDTDLKEFVKRRRTPAPRQAQNMAVAQQTAQQQFLNMVGHA